MNLDFQPICLDRTDEYREHLARTPQQGSDYSFGNLWGWRDIYGLSWAFDSGLVWIRQELPEPALWAPVGAWTDIDWQAMGPWLAGQKVIRVPEKLAEAWLRTLRPTLAESRGHWDYLYSIPELVNLDGKRFKKKRELLEQFRRNYVHDYRKLTADCVEEVLDMQAEWYRWREGEEDSQALLAENEAIRRVLEGWDRLTCLLGGALRVDGRIVAYTVAEAVCPETVVIHFEKAHTSYEGSYQAINQMFLASLDAKYTVVNREQDLDEPGLRKAKLSYNPLGFLKKFTVNF